MTGGVSTSKEALLFPCSDKHEKVGIQGAKGLLFSLNCRLNRGNIDIKKNNVLKFKGEIEMTLDELPQGKTADVTVVGGEGPLRQHFLDMGLIPGAEVTFIKFAPLGDPMELMVQGYELTLRVEDAKENSGRSSAGPRYDKEGNKAACADSASGSGRTGTGARAFALP